jgi:hypothetical protein
VVKVKYRLQPFDTLDNRREVVFLLDRLEPRERALFAAIAIRNCPGIKVVGLSYYPEPGLIEAATRDRKGRRSNEANTKLTNSIYMDILVSITQWEADANFMMEFLESTVRGGFKNIRRSLSDCVSRFSSRSDSGQACSNTPNNGFHNHLAGSLIVQI